jgi:uroporphyrinogen-III synthase
VLQQLTQYDWIIFSSNNGVKYFLERAGEKKFQLFKGRVAVVGEHTQKELQRFNRQADLLPQTFSAQGLLAAFEKIDLAGKRILLPGSDIARQELQRGLEARGAVVQRLTVYRTMCASAEKALQIKQAINEKNIDAILFFSPSAVRCLVEILDTDFISALRKRIIVFAAIGNTTAAAIQKKGLSVHILPSESTGTSLVHALADYFKKQRKTENINV